MDGVTTVVDHDWWRAPDGLDHRFWWYRSVCAARVRWTFDLEPSDGPQNPCPECLSAGALTESELRLLDGNR